MQPLGSDTPPSRIESGDLAHQQTIHSDRNTALDSTETVLPIPSNTSDGDQPAIPGILPNMGYAFPLMFGGAASNEPSPVNPTPDPEPEVSGIISKTVKLPISVSKDIDRVVADMPSESVHGYMVNILSKHRMLADATRQISQLTLDLESEKWKVLDLTKEVEALSKKLENQPQQHATSGGVINVEERVVPDNSAEINDLTGKLRIAEAQLADKEQALTKWISFSNEQTKELQSAKKISSEKELMITHFEAIVLSFCQFAEDKGYEMGGTQYFTAAYYQTEFNRIIQEHFTQAQA